MKVGPTEWATHSRRFILITMEAPNLIQMATHKTPKWMPNIHIQAFHLLLYRHICACGGAFYLCSHILISLLLSIINNSSKQIRKWHHAQTMVVGHPMYDYLWLWWGFCSFFKETCIRCETFLINSHPNGCSYLCNRIRWRDVEFDVSLIGVRVKEELVSMGLFSHD